jgi:methanogenic corrinoid protein MtbC1
MTLYRQVRSGGLPATVVAGAYRIEGRDLEAWQAARAPRPGAARVTRPRDWPAQARRLAAALGGGDADAAWTLVARLVDGGADAVELLQRALTPALVAVGEGWERG